MSTRTDPWPQGTPSWADLATPDVEKAKAFYGPLFGWDFEDQGPAYAGYHMARLHGADVVGAMPITDEMPMPPVWTTYIAVDDADKTAEAVSEAGGRVMMPVMDVDPSGRMLLATDPTGAVVGFWQAKAMSGTAVVGEHGSMRWNQLTTRDPAAARRFYSDVLGVTHSPMEGDGDYTTMDVAGRPAGGISAMDPSMPPEVPAHWQVFFQVDDAEAAVARVRELGGTVLGPVSETPYGRMAFVADDQGVTFAVNDLVGAPPPQ